MNEALPATAIDTALIKGNRGCQFLEIQRPTKQDLKTAAEAFKDASDILKASLVLLDHDCYLVQDPPQAAGTPLFKATGEPTKAADVSSELPALGIIDAEIVADRKFSVGDKVKATDYALVAAGTPGVVTEDDGSEEDASPYCVRFEGCPDTFCNAEDLEHADPVEGAVEVAEAIEDEPFPFGNKTEQKKVFEERLATLEDIFCERLDLDGNTDPYGKQIKLFRPHRDAWMALWKSEPKTAWTTLLQAIAKANTLANTFSDWAPVA